MPFHIDTYEGLLESAQRHLPVTAAGTSLQDCRSDTRQSLAADTSATQRRSGRVPQISDADQSLGHHGETPTTRLGECSNFDPGPGIGASRLVRMMLRSELLRREV